MKNRELVRWLFRANENSGRPPATKVYPDHKDIPTISTGFNLNRPDAREVITSVGADYDEIISGRDELTPSQAGQIEDMIIDEAERITTHKIGEEAYYFFK